MALSTEAKPYLISGMGSTTGGNELISAIQNSAVLSPKAFIRLQTAFGENVVATHFQNAILGTYALTARDRLFVKDAFCLPISALANVLDNIVVGTPVFSVPAGSYGPTQSVAITTVTKGAKIYYTTNGTTPTTASTLYSTPVSIASSSTLKAIAVTTGTHNSAVTSAAYVINGAVATATFSPIAGSYTGTQTVTVSSATSGATFYYSTDGSAPTRSSTLYTGPISVAVSETVKVLGTKVGFSDSAIASAAYVIS